MGVRYTDIRRLSENEVVRYSDGATFTRHGDPAYRAVDGFLYTGDPATFRAFNRALKKTK